jgi:hypothetical protein
MRKGGGSREAVGGLLHQHDVVGGAVDGGQRRIMCPAGKRGVPVDGIAAVERSSHPFDHAARVVGCGMGDGDGGNGSRRSDDGHDGGRDRGPPPSRHRPQQAVHEIDREDGEQAAHHRHMTLDRHERLHRRELVHQIPEQRKHEHEADCRRARAPIGHDQERAGEPGQRQRRSEPGPQARRPMKQEMRIPAGPDDDVLRHGVGDLRAEPVQEDVRRQKRRRIDEREDRDRRCGRPRQRGVVTAQRNARDRRDQRQQACHRQQHGADIFRRGRKPGHDPEQQRPAQLHALTQAVERREGEQEPRREEDVFFQELGVERDQRRYRGDQSGGERKPAPGHPARQHDRRQHGQAAEQRGDRASELDHRELIGLARDEVGEADRLQQQQRLEKILPALENKIGLLGLVRLRRERQVGDGVVSQRGCDCERGGGTAVSDPGVAARAGGRRSMIPKSCRLFG